MQLQWNSIVSRMLTRKRIDSAVNCCWNEKGLPEGRPEVIRGRDWNRTSVSQIATLGAYHSATRPQSPRLKRARRFASGLGQILAKTSITCAEPKSQHKILLTNPPDPNRKKEARTESPESGVRRKRHLGRQCRFTVQRPARPLSLAFLHHAPCLRQIGQVRPDAVRHALSRLGSIA